MAEEKRYYFIKPDVEYMTQNPSLMKLRRCDHGSDLVIIYHKMVAKSLPEAGYIYFPDSLDEFIEDFAIVYGEDPSLVKATIEECIRIKLIIMDEDHMFLKKVPELVESVTDAAVRKAKSRAKHKNDQKNGTENACDSDVTGGDTNVTDSDIDVTSCDNVTDCHKVTHREEKKREEKKREDIKDIYMSSQSVAQIADHTNYKEIIDLYHHYCPSLPSVRLLTDKRKRAIRSILKKYTVNDLITAFEKAEQSSFLKGECTGHGHETFKADFDFFFREDKLVSILEGKYDNNRSLGMTRAQADMNAWSQMISEYAQEDDAGNSG